jgi:crotonobetainyl-CoA:carnitine CoA-transferase CaiB-like acyl-CoA transferase
VLGLPAAAVRSALEGKTTCVLIAPFATDGPYGGYRATDLGIHALGGWANLVGDPAREPLRPGCDMVPRLEGVCAFVAALMALRITDNGGSPQFVDLSGQAVAATRIVAPWLRNLRRWLEPARTTGYRAVHGDQRRLFGCTPPTATHWEMMCHMLGLSDVLDIPGAGSLSTAGAIAANCSSARAVPPVPPL